jgi:hypothetical protein
VGTHKRQRERIGGEEERHANNIAAPVHFTHLERNQGLEDGGGARVGGGHHAADDADGLRHLLDARLLIILNHAARLQVLHSSDGATCGARAARQPCARARVQPAAVARLVLVVDHLRRELHLDDLRQLQGVQENASRVSKRCTRRERERESGRACM